MGGRKRAYVVDLTPEDRNHIKDIERSKATCDTIKKRCRILLALDINQQSVTTYAQCAYYIGVTKTTVIRTVKSFAVNGIDDTLTMHRNINSDNARRKIDGAMEARIIAMACGDPPEGFARWTLKLLSEKARVQLELDVGSEAIRRALKKTNYTLI
jgi:transposase